MDLIDLEDDQIDAEVLNSLAVTMDNFRVSYFSLKMRLSKRFSCINIFDLIFSMRWARAVQVLSERQSWKFLTFHGKTSVVLRMSKENFKSWYNTLLNIQTSSLSLECSHQRVFCFMDHPVNYGVIQ